MEGRSPGHLTPGEAGCVSMRDSAHDFRVNFLCVPASRRLAPATSPSCPWADPLSLFLASAPCFAYNGPGLQSSIGEDAMSEIFRGFTSESFAFFRELAQHNRKQWFDQNRGRYEEHVTGRFHALLTALEPFLFRLNPHFETGGNTNRNFSRINRDIRFSKDKRPYKSSYYLYVFDRRRTRDADGRLYVGLSAECLTVGFSIYATWGRGPKGVLETVFRKRLETRRQVFDALLQNIVRGKRYETYWYRREQGEWALHPGLPRRDDDWLKLHGWVVRRVFQPTARSLPSPALARQIQVIFADLYPLYVFTSSTGPRWEGELRKRH